MASSSVSPSSADITHTSVKEEDHGSNDGTSPGAAKGKKKETKKRKVGQACVYCRRSHMTCDSSRPCQRCIKRDIGHLCHDETAGKGHGHAHHAMPKGKAVESKASASSVKALSTPTKQLKTPEGAPDLEQSMEAGPSNLNLPFANTQSRVFMSPTPPTAATHREVVDPTLSQPQQAGTPRQVDALQAYITALTQGAPSTGLGPYSSQSPAGALRAADANPVSSNPTVYRSDPNLAGGRSSLGGLSSDALGSLVSGATHPPGPPTQRTSNENAFNASANGAAGGPFMGNTSWPTMTSGAAGLGGAGFLGLGGSHGLYTGGPGGGGDAAGGHEYNLLSEFLESLDGPLHELGSNPSNPSNFANPFESPSSAVTPTLERQGSPWATPKAPEVVESNVLTSKGRQKRSRPDSPSTRSPLRRVTIPAEQAHSSSDTKGGYIPSSLKGFSTKTEKFLVTAADQVDGPRDERLSKVIRAKYDAGLLRPYNHVNGYARLNAWMERNVSPASRRRILKPLSVFRPRFRAVAQSLSDLDLVWIEEAFERLLLDYDRVFSTQGIPACLWRRTGEVYKGNREFAELVGVGIEELREGRLCIYELMEEESACNYWEKYGAVSFDPGQKAVLTSCVLNPRSTISSASGGTFSRRSTVNGQASPAALTPAGRSGSNGPPSIPPLTALTSANTSNSGPGTGAATPTAGPVTMSNREPPKQSINCCFSFTIRRDKFGVPTAIVGNFLPIA